MNVALVYFYCFIGRPWPAVLGAGIGLGMGYSNCQHDFNSNNTLYGEYRKVRTL